MEKKKQSPQKKASNNTNKNDNQRVNKNMDVRFKRIKNDEQKIVIDDRFKDMFTNPSFTSEYEVDKYGQKIDSSTAEDLKKFYSIEDEKEETKEDNIIEDKKAQKQPEKRSKSQILKDKIKNKATQVEKPKKAQLKRKPKEEEAFHWSDESSDDDDEEEEEDEDEEEKEEIEDGDETKRIALVNLDWDNIKAVDILVALNSFLPKSETSAYVKKVSIIPSLFGLEQIEIEEREGPQGLWDESENKEEEKEDEEEDEEEENENNINNDEFNKEKLRKYQLKRMKYYFAVAEFDSKETALHVYRQCDGVEMGRTSNKFDLRFIPDDVTFEERQKAKDEATDVPMDYKTPIFYSSALQHSNVKLTWDDDDQDRIQITRKGKFTKDQLNEMDFRAYLASSSSDESEEEKEDQSKNKKRKKKVRAKYKSLLEESLPQQELQEDMEVTFTPGLSKNIEDVVNRSLNKPADTSVWDEFLRKRSEKKKLKKKERKQNEEEGEDNNNNKGKSKGKGGKKSKEEEEREKAELELLLLSRNSKTKKKSAQETGDDSKKKKGKKGKKGKGEEEDDFFFDVQDSRFDAMYSKLQDFDIDPTDSRFKNSKATKQILAERQTRFEKRKLNTNNNKKDETTNVDVKSLVSSIKRKADERQKQNQRSNQPLKRRKLDQ